MPRQPFSWTVLATAGADGTCQIVFPNPPPSFTWEGSVFVTGGGPAAYWTAALGAPGSTSPLIGVWLGSSTYNQVQVVGPLTLTVQGQLIVPGATVTATWIGVSELTWITEPIGPGQIPFGSGPTTTSFPAGQSSLVTIPAGIGGAMLDLGGAGVIYRAALGLIRGGGRIQGLLTGIAGHQLRVAVASGQGGGDLTATYGSSSGGAAGTGTNLPAHAGGGCSVVYDVTASVLLAVAGGAGGYSGVHSSPGAAEGGVGGGSIAAAGAGSNGGGGGTQSTAGTAGPGINGGVNGTAGSGPAGGAGATDASNPAGGGGGGGYFGGGGGGSDGTGASGGGGGGGSSYADTSVMGATDTAGENSSGDGYARISYLP
jgi:hypothetical protein